MRRLPITSTADEDPYGHETRLWHLDREAFRARIRGLAGGALVFLGLAAPLVYAVIEYRDRLA